MFSIAITCGPKILLADVSADSSAILPAGTDGAGFTPLADQVPCPKRGFSLLLTEVLTKPHQNRYIRCMQKIIPARFFRIGSTGPEPVREWLRSLSSEERRKIGQAIRLVELGWPIGMPTCGPLGDGIFEVRVHLDTRIARILFCIADGEMWLLHGFMKTTQKTPLHDLRLARQRKNQLLGG